MVSCGQFTMLSMAPSSVMSVPPSSKPKIGFSIDSIVGSGGELRGHAQDSNLSSRSDSPDRPTSSLSDYNYPLELRYNESANQLTTTPGQLNTKNDRSESTKITEFHRNFTARLPEHSPNSQDALDKRLTSRHSPPPAIRTPISPAACSRTMQRTPSPPIAHHQPSAKGPIVVPGIPAAVFRPFPMQASNMSDVKPVPAYLNSPEMVGSHNPHFLAQFQMAAALAHGQSQGFPHGPGLPQHHPQFNNPNVVRESYPLYPWLISRHGRIFPHRFPGNFLLQPFRKPKRVRTAFSPSQLLKLEHAFESNHYVVGAERKTLAQALSLTETQVKVWFQNRRTKHKRMQQEEDAKNGGSSAGNGSGGNGDDQNSPGDNCSNTQASFEDDEEDELIDMDDCPSDQEGDLVQ